MSDLEKAQSQLIQAYLGYYNMRARDFNMKNRTLYVRDQQWDDLANFCRVLRSKGINYEVVNTGTTYTNFALKELQG